MRPRPLHATSRHFNRKPTMNEIQHLAKPKDGPAPRWFHLAVAASMVISAVSALIATVHTGRTMTALVEQNAKLVRAGSTPVLEFTHGNGDDKGNAILEFHVKNAGSGMARVVWFEFRLDNKPMKDMGEVGLALSPRLASDANLNARLSFSTGPIAGRVFSPGNEQRFFGWTRPPVAEQDLRDLWNKLDEARFKRITVEACFCSVFQECWTSKLNGDVPVPSAECANDKRVSLRG
jgi:hypothetical protein